MTRQEFVMQTVASTLKNYLDLFRPPHTTIDAQERCLADAERLADRVFGVLDAPAEVSVEARADALLGRDRQRLTAGQPPRGIVRRMRGALNPSEL